mmetsp:Transcript_51163/g.147662  ORF Transcript_51163/g.147662 Transcript_51163/m.147662 type:complete len:213 (+) Transcript_51163:1229-1867(+)
MSSACFSASARAESISTRTSCSSCRTMSSKAATVSSPAVSLAAVSDVALSASATLCSKPARDVDTCAMARDRSETSATRVSTSWTRAAKAAKSPPLPSAGATTPPPPSISTMAAERREVSEWRALTSSCIRAILLQRLSHMLIIRFSKRFSASFDRPPAGGPAGARSLPPAGRAGRGGTAVPLWAPSAPGAAALATGGWPASMSAGARRPER